MLTHLILPGEVLCSLRFAFMSVYEVTSGHTSGNCTIRRRDDLKHGATKWINLNLISQFNDWNAIFL